MREVIQAPAVLEGSPVPPGDKSISHRALLLNSIARRRATVSNLCVGDDRASILRCLRGLGVRIEHHIAHPWDYSTDNFVVHGVGPDGFSEPSTVLNAGNSATTFRLVSGLLATQPFFSVISGDPSLRERPMDRIVSPLMKMGATIMGRGGDCLPPLAIRGGNIHGVRHKLAVASAQVKSSLLIAGLLAEGETVIEQPALSRDHTERMLAAMGADVEVDGLTITVRRSELNPLDVQVPGDMSSTAFWLVAAASHPNACIRVKHVGINPSRTGVLDVLAAMGARIHKENVRAGGSEPTADLVAESSDLRATEIAGDMIPRVIDELPVLALAACFARGTTTIRDAGELRVKESDRITATANGLNRLGARIEELEDGMSIRGVGGLTGAESESYGDHRIAMTMGVAGLLAKGETTVIDSEAADVSYPGFWDTLRSLQGTTRAAS